MIHTSRPDRGTIMNRASSAMRNQRPNRPPADAGGRLTGPPPAFVVSILHLPWRSRPRAPVRRAGRRSPSGGNGIV